MEREEGLGPERAVTDRPSPESTEEGLDRSMADSDSS